MPCMVRAIFAASTSQVQCQWGHKGFGFEYCDGENSRRKLCSLMSRCYSDPNQSWIGQTVFLLVPTLLHGPSHRLTVIARTIKMPIWYASIWEFNLISILIPTKWHPYHTSTSAVTHIECGLRIALFRRQISWLPLKKEEEEEVINRFNIANSEPDAGQIPCLLAHC